MPEAEAEAGGGGLQTGIYIAKEALKITAKVIIAGAKAGVAAHNFLDKHIKPDEVEPQNADFPPLDVQVPENLSYKIKQIELLKDTAVTLGTPDAFAATKGIIDQINNDLFTVAFVGRYTTGKSALLNKLLGRNILKSAAGETTKSLAWLFPAENGEEWACSHDYADDLKIVVPVEKIADIPDDPPVLNIFARINADILNHNAVLIDTPGLGAGPSGELTLKALENADAAVLVVDHYPVEALDTEVIEILKKEGKADRLFVVVNKMDEVETEAGREGLVNDRLDWLSELGIRTRIYPLSHTNEINFIDDAFTRFRGDLIDNITTGLGKAREKSVEQRIKNTAERLRIQCEEAEELSKLQGSQERDRIKKEARTEMDRIESETKNIIRNNEREIQRLKQSVLDSWSVKFGGLKDRIDNIISNANDAQLNNKNQLFAEVEADIRQFLLDEFKNAEEQIQDRITRELNNVGDINLPIPQQEGRIDVNMTRWGKNIKIPPEYGTFGLLALTFFTKAHGFFSILFSIPHLFIIWVLSPFINKIFEQLFKAGYTIDSAIFKTKLQEKIYEQLPEVDKRVRQKIEDFFNTLWNQINSLGNATIKDRQTPLRSQMIMADEFSNGKKAAELEKCRRGLNSI